MRMALRAGGFERLGGDFAFRGVDRMANDARVSCRLSKLSVASRLLYPFGVRIEISLEVFRVVEVHIARVFVRKCVGECGMFVVEMSDVGAMAIGLLAISVSVPRVVPE